MTSYTCMLSYQCTDRTTTPTIQQPGFNFNCHTPSLVNRVCTGQGLVSCKPVQMGRCQIIGLRLRPAADHEPYHLHV